MSKTGGSLGAQGRLLRGASRARSSGLSAATARRNRRCSRSSRASPSRPAAAPRPSAAAGRQPAGRCAGHRLAERSRADRPREHPLCVNGATLCVGTQHLRSVQVCAATKSTASSTRRCPERSRRIVAFAEIERFLDTPVKAPRSVQRHASGACAWPSRWPRSAEQQSNLSLADRCGMIIRQQNRPSKLKRRTGGVW